MIILVGGEKGGTGKTTLATNIAQMRVSAGKDVLLVDSDKQESASSWAGLREEIGVKPSITTVQKVGKNIARDLLDLAKRYDDLIIDAGGRDSVELRAAMVAAHKLFIPVQASQFDVWTLGNMSELVDQAQALNPSLEAYVVLNRASPNPVVSEADEARELFNDFENLNFCGVTFRERIAFRKASSGGLGINELSPMDEKAGDEMSQFYEVVFDAKF